MDGGQERECFKARAGASWSNLALETIGWAGASLTLRSSATRYGHRLEPRDEGELGEVDHEGGDPDRQDGAQALRGASCFVPQRTSVSHTD